jgi:integrase
MAATPKRQATWQPSQLRWVVSAYHQGRRVWGKSRIEGLPGKLEAERRLAAKLTELQGVEPYPRGSLGAFIEEVYWPEAVVILKPPTLKRYEQYCRIDLLPLLMAPMSQLRLPVLRSWANSLEGSPKTRINKISFLRGVLTKARNLSLIEHQDWRELALPRNPRKKIEGFTLAEVGLLLGQCSGRDQCYWAPIFLSAVLGLRLGEVLGLEPGDLSEAPGGYKVLTISRQRGATGEIVPWLKSKEEGETKRLPLPAWIAEIIEGFNLPLLGPTGRLLSPSTLDHAFERLCRQAGVPYRSFHKLRHAAGSNMRAAGVPESVIQRGVLDHTTIQMSLGYMQTRDQEIIEALGKTYSGVTEAWGRGVTNPGPE